MKKEKIIKMLDDLSTTFNFVERYQKAKKYKLLIEKENLKNICPICKGYGQHSWQQGGNNVCKFCNGTGKSLQKEDT